VPTLCAGAALVLRDDAALTSVPSFLAALDDHAVSVANLPTAFWTVLGAEAKQIPSSLRLMIVGGERVSAAALARWRTAHPGLRWLNGYGPTETTITATLYDASGWQDGQGDVPIGRPVGPARVLVAAPDGSPAPFGVAGELWIGGAGLARGYLGRPDLTAAAFVDTPWSPVAPRFYRTGDLVRWTDTGLLAFHGRIDRQIKIRGYRIELSALEARLERDPAIARAAATLDRSGSSAARILIWVQPAIGTNAPEPASLHQLVGSVLPPAVRPVILVVDDMPVTPGGKIDIAQLPRPEVDAGGPDAEEAWEPAGADVARMQGVFASILGLDRVGPDQSFFDLGGHSLVSLRLMSQIEREFGRRLPVTLLQNAPTPRLLVAVLDGDIAPARPEGLVEVQPDGDLPPIYAVQVLGPDASLFRPLSWVLGKRQPFFGINLDVFDPLTPDTIEGISEVMARSIRTHSAGRPVHLIGVSHGAQFAYELAGQLRAAGCDVATLIILDATGPDGRPQMPRTVGKILRRIVVSPGDLLRDKIGNLRDALRFRLEAIKDSFLTGFLAEGRPRDNLTAVSYGVRIDSMVNRFQPSVYDGRVIVVRATEDFNDAPEAIESCLGWRRIVSGPIELVEITGGHLTLLDAPHVERLAAALRERLIAAETSGSFERQEAIEAKFPDGTRDVVVSEEAHDYSPVAQP
jgi:thioesterase domain-containing protein/acyl carrier protein